LELHDTLDVAFLVFQEVDGAGRRIAEDALEHVASPLECVLDGVGKVAERADGN